MDEQSLRRLVGWPSLLFGVGMLLAPYRAARLFGAPGRAGLVRFLALRDLTIGLGALSQPNVAPWVRGPGGEVRELPHLVRTISGIPHGMFNVVMAARLEPGSADAVIEEMLAEYAARGLPFSWLVSPAVRPVDLGARLAAHGLRHLFDDPWMALDLRALDEDQPAPPPGFRVVEV